LIYKYTDYLNENPKTFELPRMSLLKALHLNPGHHGLIKMVCRTLSFCETFPNLEVMSFVNGNKILNLDFLASEPCPKLKSMELCFSGTLELTVFENVAKMYSESSLTCLKLSSRIMTGEKILRIIWTHLINLRELELGFKESDPDLDSWITGISAKDCKKIKSDRTYWNFLKGLSPPDKKNKLSELSTKLRVSPSIVDIKNLNRLQLNYPGSGLTDITGYFALCQLQNIKHIHIDSCEFSKTCCVALKNQLDLGSWVFRREINPVPVPGLDNRRNRRPLTEDIIRPYHYPYANTEDETYMKSREETTYESEWCWK